MLNQDGFTYWVSIFNVETVPWSAVERVELSQDRFVKNLIGRYLPDFCPTLSVFTRSELGDRPIWERFFRWIGTGDKVFMAPYLTRSKKEVFELLQTYLAVSKET